MLTRNISVTDTDAIVIQSGGVTLDLNGYTIRNSGTLGVGVLVSPTDPVTSVRIMNGRISGGAYGIMMPAPVQGTNPGINIVGVEIGGPALDGIRIQGAGPGTVVVDVDVRDTGGDGIRSDKDGAGVTFTWTILIQNNDIGVDNTSTAGGPRINEP